MADDELPLPDRIYAWVTTDHRGFTGLVASWCKTHAADGDAEFHGARAASQRELIDDDQPEISFPKKWLVEFVPVAVLEVREESPEVIKARIEQRQLEHAEAQQAAEEAARRQVRERIAANDAAKADRRCKAATTGDDGKAHQCRRNAPHDGERHRWWYRSDAIEWD